MKLNKLKYIVAVLAVTFFASCDDQDDNTGDSGLTPTSPTVTITEGSGSTSFDLSEKDTTYTFTATLSEINIVDITLNVSATGTATEDEDFELSTHQINIPSGSLTGSVSVTIFTDTNTSEETETFTVTIGSADNSNANFTATDFVFTLDNTTDFATYDYVTLVASWDAGLETVAGDSFCDAFDVDIILLDENGANPDYAMATGACPEEGDFDLADGTYLITSSLYSGPDLGQYTVNIPVTYTLYRYNNDGTIAGQSITFTVQSFTSADDDSLHLDAMFTVADGVVTITNAAGDVSYGSI